MLLPIITWLAYATVSYLAWPAWFRWRYGRSAFAGHFPPATRYEWVDLGLAACLLAYSAWIALGPPASPMFDGRGLWIGLGVFAAGAALRAWAVVTLGPNWRIGQDENDPDAAYVATGPYRFLHHPINTALVLVAIGQALMTGLDARSIFLLSFSTAYLLIQARAEERHWRRRRGAAGRA
jgi:protein-S-isoprenylcysteine O-methyltransferase Ste14